MAPLPSNLTHRVWFDYETSTDGIEHTVMVRVNATNPAPGDAARAAFAAVLNAFGAAQFRSGWRVVRSRIALANSDIALPTPVGTALAGFTGSSTGAYPPSREAVEGRFVGRGTTSGRRVSFSLYGWAAGVDISNFRVVSGPAPAFAVLVQAAVNGLNALGNGAFTDVSNDQVLWYPYLNLQYNSYWEGRIRLS